jgi:predicted acylesterase/phospholipase RssA
MEFDLVFEGGGAKGIVFVGAVQEFEALGHTADRLLGTSAGAITATLLARTIHQESAALLRGGLYASASTRGADQGSDAGLTQDDWWSAAILVVRKRHLRLALSRPRVGSGVLPGGSAEGVGDHSPGMCEGEALG